LALTNLLWIELLLLRPKNSTSSITLATCFDSVRESFPLTFRRFHILLLLLHGYATEFKDNRINRIGAAAYVDVRIFGPGVGTPEHECPDIRFNGAVSEKAKPLGGVLSDYILIPYFVPCSARTLLRDNPYFDAVSI
jgi:hypothetical protein